MELLVGTSLIAAFIAGMAALFAPCCITVLLPSYFASIFKEKQKVFLMTFIFFLGIAAVFLPLGLGVAALGAIFSRYHNAIFAAGGGFLLLMGFMQITGRHFSLPFTVHPSLKNTSAPSIFLLGVFSGIATTCCAPVLAGVLALAALPGSIFWGGVYTLSYVLGMVAPLFLIASFLDKTELMKKITIIRKPISYSLLGRQVNLTIAEAVSGATFLGMGSFILYLAFQNKLFTHSAYQTDINIYLTKILNAINGVVGFIPEYVWALIFISILILIIKKSINQLNLNIKNKLMEQKNNIGVIVGVIGIISLVAAIMIFQGNKSQGNGSAGNGAVASNNNSADDMASHHSGTPQNKNTADLNNLIGSPAPSFSLSDRNGKIYSSDALKGKNIILFFNEGLMCYPACWNQIVALSQDKRLANDYTVILSVVVDPKDQWQSAINKMPALADAIVVFDTDTAVSRSLNMLNTASSMHYGSLPGHTYVVIDKEGIVRHVFDDPNMAIHNEQLAAEIAKLKS